MVPDMPPPPQQNENNIMVAIMCKLYKHTRNCLIEMGTVNSIEL